MTLPVSMEDTELFPKSEYLNQTPGRIPLDTEVFEQMRSSLSRLWWSRLVISVRGYVVNYVASDDETLFHIDDAFIAIHRYLAETNSDQKAAVQFAKDLDAITLYPDISETLFALAKHRMPGPDPFKEGQIVDSLARVFGTLNPITYQLANGQKLAYIVFMRVLGILQERWKAERAKKKGIRFETDPEWQPDERVVLFQEFYQGNRTWVLLDFDRYVLQQWRPKGSNIIFGDRFVEKKVAAGFQLCHNCGMLEQQPSQFPQHHGQPFCSSECLKDSQTVAQ